MNKGLIRVLEETYEHWVLSPDESKVVAWNSHGDHASIWDTTDGKRLLTIEVEMEKWVWAPGGKELISHDYRVTNIWDATTGKYLRSIEAMYDIPDD